MSEAVSVVICTHTSKRWPWLLEAVASVRSQRLAPGELVVVVDHNPELLARARAAIPDAVVVANRERPGLSGGRNSGLAVASGAVVAFLDDDELADPDWLWWLHGGYADSRVLGVGGAVLPRWPGGRPAWFPREFDWVVGCSYRGMPEAVAPVRNLLGGNMSFRRTAFDEVGGFRWELGRAGAQPMGCEETELCIRLRQRRPGALLLLDQRAVVRARVPAARASWSYFRARCWAEGRSKAIVTGLLGVADGLATERRYAMRTLPMGVVAGLRDAAGLDPNGLARAGAIVGGVVTATGGYATGKLTGSRRRR